jgi:hypothetical protein
MIMPLWVAGSNSPSQTFGMRVLPFEQSVAIVDKAIDITISLKLKPAETSVEVRGRSRLANSDPNYQALRGGALTHVYQVQNLVLARDVATSSSAPDRSASCRPCWAAWRSGYSWGTGTSS